MTTTRWWAVALALSAGCSSTVGAKGDASIVDAATAFDGGSEVDVAVVTDSGRCSLANAGDGAAITPGPSDAPYVVDLAYDNTLAQCALMSDGTVWCRGLNVNGQLGRGNEEGFFPPRPVQGLTDVVQLVGTLHSFECALKRDGTVWCWGSSAIGALGVPHAEDENCSRLDGGMIGCRTTPTQVRGLTDVTQIAMGVTSVCAVKRDGTVWCWGNDRLIPGGRSEVPVQTSLTDVVSMVGQDVRWLVRTRDGSWRSTDDDVTLPTGAEPARNEWGSHACYRLPDATMRCQGANPSGVLGDGRSSNYLEDRYPAVDPGLCGVREVATSRRGSCALLADGSVWCWGDGVFPETSANLQACSDGTRSTRCAPRPARVEIDRVVHVVMGAGPSCAMREDHTVWCWDRSSPGRLEW